MKQVEILEMLAANKNVKEISDTVDLSPRTVMAIIDKLKSKTGTSSVEALIEYVKKEQIID